MSANGDVIKRKIAAAQVRKPDAAVMAFGEQLISELNESLLLEPKFMLSPVFQDAETTNLASFYTGLPAKSLFCNTDTVLIHLDNPLAYYWLERGLSGEASGAGVPEDYTPSAVDLVLSRPLFECLFMGLQKDMPKTIRMAEHQLSQALTIERNVDNLRYLEESAKVVVLKYGFEDPDTETTYIARIVFPLSVMEEITVNINPLSIDDAPNSGIWTNHMQEKTRALPLRLTVAIDTMQMNVKDISALAPGQVLTIPRENMSNLAVAIEDGHRLQIIANGRLGAHKGHKAVKLNADPSPALAQIVDEG